MSADIAFSAPLFATPLAHWASASQWSLAGVFGSTQQRTREAKVLRLDRSGRALGQFPLTAALGSQINPGRVVLSLDAAGGVTLVTRDGSIVRQTPDGGERVLARAPALAMPVAVLRSEASRADAVFVVGSEFKPLSAARHAFAILRDGVPLPGFPLDLPGLPEATEPCIDWRQARAFVALGNSTIDGIDLRKAERLPGFPLVLPRERGRPLGGHRLALTPGGEALLATVRTGRPVRVELPPGRPPRVVPAAAAPGAERIWALALVEDRSLLGFDLASNSLVELDAAGAPRPVWKHSVPQAHDAMHLVSAGDALLCVGINTRGEEDKVAELFEARAPSEVKERVQSLADRHAQRKSGGAPLTPDQEEDRAKALREMKRTWLENQHGLVETNATVQAEQFTSLQLLSVTATGVQASGEARRLAATTDETGITASPHLAPTPVLDAQRSVRGFFVGLNRVDRFGKADGSAAALGVLVATKA